LSLMTLVKVKAAHEQDAVKAAAKKRTPVLSLMTLVKVKAAHEQDAVKAAAKKRTPVLSLMTLVKVKAAHEQDAVRAAANKINSRVERDERDDKSQGQCGSMRINAAQNYMPKL